MPGKVNPVIPEAVSQAALLVMGYDTTIATAVRPRQPRAERVPAARRDLPAARASTLLAHACEILRRHCVEGIEADEERCRAHVEASTAAATALVPGDRLRGGLRRRRARPPSAGATIRDVVVADGLLTAEQFDELLTPEAVCRLGTPQPLGRPVED